MKILKKCLAVLGVACMLFAVAIPCFAWEWNGSTVFGGPYTLPIAPIEASYLSTNSPVFGNVSSSPDGDSRNFTSKGNLQTLTLHKDFIDYLYSGRFSLHGDTTDSWTQPSSRDEQTVTLHYGSHMGYSSATINLWLDAMQNYPTINGYKFNQFNFLNKSLDEFGPFARVEYLYNANNASGRCYSDLYSTFSTDYRFITGLFDYTLYQWNRDPDLPSGLFECYITYEDTDGELVTEFFDYPSTEYTVEKTSFAGADYSAYKYNIGDSLANYIHARISANNPIVTVSGANFYTQTAVKGVRRNSLVAVVDTNSYDTFQDPNLLSRVVSANLYGREFVFEGDQANGLFEFLATSVTSVLNIELAPGLAISTIFSVVIGVILLIWLLKMFAGG